MQLINWGLLKHPVNYIVVGMMVLIAAIAFNYVVKWEQS